MRPKPNDGFAWVQAAGGPALVGRALEAHASHLFTTRGWPLGDPDADRDAGWAAVARALDVEPSRLVRVHQVHGAAVVACRKGTARSASTALPAADIIVSDDPDLALAVQVADCVPILIADRHTGSVGAAHAGWRGLAARVPQTLVQALARQFGSRPTDLVAAIGPSISAERYEVDAPVRDAFAGGGFAGAHLSAWFPKETRAGHWQFDGWASARDQLEDAGLPAGQIAVAGLCTASLPDDFCSYRRDGRRAGRLAAVVRARARSGF